MYDTSANDLETIANALSTVAQKYTNGAQQMDQHVVTLEGVVSHLVSGGVQQWKGLSSEAFQGAWQERKVRMQQASLLMTQSAGYMRQLVQTIEAQLPAIRADQSMMGNSVYNTLSGSAQSSIQNEESQAQNSILMAIATFNSMLEQLAEEIGDCPQDDQNEPYPGYRDNVSRSDSGSTDGKTPEERIKGAIDDPAIAELIIAQANQEGANLEDVATLLEKGITTDVVSQLINNGADLKDVGINTQTLLDGGVKVEFVNGWLKNGTNLNDAVAIMNQGVDLNLLGTSSKVGDFTGLTGATVNEVVSRIPADTVIEHWEPELGRIEEGMNFKFKDVNGKTVIIRMHEADPLAPAGSNAANGWVLRVRIGGKYMDATGKLYTQNALSNPASSNFDPQGANKTHIPIQEP